jgi:formylglycine-generating enzyme required for sulfatase activity
MNKSVIVAGLGLWLLAGSGAALAAGKGKNFTNSIGMEFVRVPAGSFIMGVPLPPSQCPPDDPFTQVNEFERCKEVYASALQSDHNLSHRSHNVTISQDFYIGKYEVTQAQWYAVMGNNPSYFKSDVGGVGGDSRNHPVEKVSWDDVQAFIKKLNASEGKSYRLPSEAEWEYACRSGGKDEKYCGGNDIKALAWYFDNSHFQGSSAWSTHRVGTKKANGLGIYDMTGNVREWCQDWYDKHYYGQSPAADPSGPSGGEDRVIRGGSGATVGDDGDVLAVRRGYYSPGDNYHSLGFRLVTPQSDR